MPNLSALSTITTSATALSNLILVSPQKTVGYQPQNKPNPDGSPSTEQQPPALLFHYEGEQTVSLTSDITDHFVEDNTAIQDQIALRPEMITVHGFIGELNDVAPGILGTAQALANKLFVLSAYTPVLSETALIAYNEAFLLYQTAVNAANAAISAWSSITGSGGESVINGNGIETQPNQNNQQKYFQQFYGYWRNRTLFTVQTPWAVFQNMAIMNFRSIQSAETKMITDYELTFKLIRTAQTITDLPYTNVQGRLGSQSAGVTDLGTSTPASSTSLNGAIGQSYPGSFA